MAWLVNSPAPRMKSKYRFMFHLLEVHHSEQRIACGCRSRVSSATTCHRRRGAFWRVVAVCCRRHTVAEAVERMSSGPPDDRLDSWKGIAAYLGRGVRTVQRWEREEGLPVHRLAHDKGGNVYARREELAAWWESRRRTLAAQPSDQPDEKPSVPRLERVTLTSGLTAWPALSSAARLIRIFCE